MLIYDDKGAMKVQDKGKGGLNEIRALVKEDSIQCGGFKVTAIINQGDKRMYVTNIVTSHDLNM
jgi:hypothetical protein